MIDTVRKGFPLNTMYWAVAGDGFELMDGQQRTISICQYVNGDYSVELTATPSASKICPQNGSNRSLITSFRSMFATAPTDKLDWFKVINIAGLALTDQELRNAIVCRAVAGRCQALVFKKRRASGGHRQQVAQWRS